MSDYVVGYLVVLGLLVFAADNSGVPRGWVVAGILVGLGVLALFWAAYGIMWLTGYGDED